MSIRNVALNPGFAYITGGTAGEATARQQEQHPPGGAVQPNRAERWQTHPDEQRTLGIPLPGGLYPVE